jgi:transposase-like protein
MAKKNKKYAEEFKREVLEMAAKPDVKLAPLKRHLGITLGLIYT